MIIDRIFYLLCTCESISEFKVKSVMSTSFEIGNKPLPRGMALFIISKISEFLFPSRYVFWNNAPVIGVHRVDNESLTNLVRNLYELNENCELFANLKQEDTIKVRRQMTDWISSNTDTNKAWLYVCKLVSILSKV